MTDIYVVVENGYNTSYIDTLIMSLFYKPSYIENMLNCCAEQSNFYYIQDMIKHNFVDPIRRKFSINSDILNELRNYCVMCGWKQNENVTDLFSIADFYSFLLAGISSGYLMFKIIDNKNGSINQQKMPFINIKLNDDKYDVSINNLLNDWVSETLLSNNENLTYSFVDIPFVIGLHIDRTMSDNKSSAIKIDIMKKIKFNNNADNLQTECSWNIHSVICYTETNAHYYCLCQLSNNDWYLYDSTLKPSLCKIDTDTMKNENFSNKIKQECMFIFYELCNICY